MAPQGCIRPRLTTYPFTIVHIRSQCMRTHRIICYEYFISSVNFGPAAAGPAVPAPAPLLLCILTSAKLSVMGWASAIGQDANIF